MRASFAFLFLIGPRMAFLIYWFSVPEFVFQAFKGWIWPLLGVIFLPWTTFVTVLAYGYNAISGGDWLWVGFAFAIDLLTYGITSYYRVKGPAAFDLLKLIQRSLALRTFLLILMTLVSGFGAFVVLVSFSETYPLTLANHAESLGTYFWFYLLMGFLSGFANPKRFWLPALLFCAPTLLVLAFLSFQQLNLDVLAASFVATFGAALLGAWVNAALQNRSQVGRAD